MKDRLVAFTVEHPQLEQSPIECTYGRKKASVWKNQASPALLLGSLNLFTPTSSPLRSQASPFQQAIFKSRSPSPQSFIASPLQSLLNKFPKYTKANPKYIPTSPIIETILPNKRLCDFATKNILVRKSMN